MKTINIKDAPKGQDDKITFTIEGIEKLYHLSIDTQQTGYGIKRFFKCPICGARRQHLYLVGESLACRLCINRSSYWGIQNTTESGHIYFSYKMKRIAFKYGIELKFPFTYYQMLLNRPKGMHHATWERIARQLQILENMRFQSIFLQRRYSPKTIAYVLKNCLYMYDLHEIETYCIDWKGVIKGIESWIISLDINRNGAD